MKPFLRIYLEDRHKHRIPDAADGVFSRIRKYKQTEVVA